VLVWEHRKKGRNSSREQHASQSSKRETRFSSTTGEAVAEATSPPRKNGGLIRKGEGVKQVYRKVGVLQWGSPMEILMQISRWRFSMQDR
jgi:hypothetical protein